MCRRDALCRQDVVKCRFTQYSMVAEGKNPAVMIFQIFPNGSRKPYGEATETPLPPGWVQYFDSVSADICFKLAFYFARRTLLFLC